MHQRTRPSSVGRSVGGPFDNVDLNWLFGVLPEFALGFIDCSCLCFAPAGLQKVSGDWIPGKDQSVALQVDQASATATATAVPRRRPRPAYAVHSGSIRRICSA